MIPGIYIYHRYYPSFPLPHTHTYPTTTLPFPPLHPTHTYPTTTSPLTPYTPIPLHPIHIPLHILLPYPISISFTYTSIRYPIHTYTLSGLVATLYGDRVGYIGTYPVGIMEGGVCGLSQPTYSFIHSFLPSFIPLYTPYPFNTPIRHTLREWGTGHGGGGNVRIA